MSENMIDKVKLYPFSPLKLLHETRKLTATQAKFFVALVCLYFERGGKLEWLEMGGEEKWAAQYAPYCGVTKKTFIKMINALQEVGSAYLNDCGQIVPIFAQEIRDAVRDGTHQILECTETDAGVKVEAAAADDVAQAQARKEGVAAFAQTRFQGVAEGSDIREGASENGAPLTNAPLNGVETMQGQETAAVSTEQKDLTREEIRARDKARARELNGNYENCDEPFVAVVDGVVYKEGDVYTDGAVIIHIGTHNFVMTERDEAIRIAADNAHIKAFCEEEDFLTHLHCADGYSEKEITDMAYQEAYAPAFEAESQAALDWDKAHGIERGGEIRPPNNGWNYSPERAAAHLRGVEASKKREGNAAPSKL